MRSNAVLKLFRAIAVLMMLLGLLHAGAVFFFLGMAMMQEGLAGLGHNDIEALLLMWPLQFCAMPFLTFWLGAILFVQVEIASRSGPPRDDA
jgi:hypothetical protein